MILTKDGKEGVQRWIAVVCLGASLAVTGCSSESTESTNVRTDGVYADLSVEADSSSNVVVEAALKVGGPNSNTYLELTGGDVLTASNGGAAQVMTRTGSGDWVRYRTTLINTPLNSDSQITISLTRAADIDAPSSSVSLAPAITVTQPAADYGSYSRAADDLQIAWDPAAPGDTTRLTIEGSCIYQLQRNMTGVTSITIPANTLQEKFGLSATDKGCSATIRLERIRYGIVDSAYGEGGSLMSTRMADRVFFSYP